MHRERPSLLLKSLYQLIPIKGRGRQNAEKEEQTNT